MVIGFLNYQSRKPSHLADHYIHNQVNTTLKPIALQITEVLKPSDYSNKYIANVLQIDSVHTLGKVLLLLKKENENNFISIDDQLLVYGNIIPLATPLNPDQFNYKGYLQNQEVYGEIRGSLETVLLHKKNTFSLRALAEKARNRVMGKLEASPLQPAERSIIQALLLGDKKDIDKELYADYAAAGAVHILAVSGLHVGVLYFLLGGLFLVVKRLPKGAYIHPLLVVILLWGFAFVTGLSPSVTRAVTMFSFFGLAQLLNRRTSTINTLALSFLFLLLLKPMWLFHVGFQLSYLAVFFIVWTVPLLSKIYTPHTWLGKRFWDIIYVSIAAQLGVFPLSIFYFHQFPGLFLLSNILILPLLGILLSGGVFIIFLLLLGGAPDALVIGYGKVIALLNRTIQWIASQETFLLKDLPFSFLNVLLCYAIIVTGILFLKNYTAKKVFLFLTSILLFVIALGIEKTVNNTNELIIFHKAKHTLLTERSGNSLKLFTTDTLLKNEKTYPLASFLIKNSINKVTKYVLPPYFKFDGNVYMVIDSSGSYLNRPKKATILLTQSPKIHLEKLIDTLQPSLIVADGSNYTSFVKRWKKTCADKKISFHYTGEKGAYIIKAE